MQCLMLIWQLKDLPFCHVAFPSKLLYSAFLPRWILYSSCILLLLLYYKKIHALPSLYVKNSTQKDKVEKSSEEKSPHFTIYCIISVFRIIKVLHKFK